MEKSSPSENDESRHGRRRSFDCVNELHKPLLPDSEAADSRTSMLKDASGGVHHKLFRGGSAPSIEAPTPDPADPKTHLKHPFQNKDNFSILYKAVLGIIIYFAVGILSFFLAEDDLFGTKTSSNFIDALYFSVVTLTTVGYGDLVPGSTAGKLFTCAYVFFGFGLVGALVSGAANYIVERQEQIVVHAIKKKELKGYEQAEYEHAQAATWKAYVSGVSVIVLAIVGLGFLLRVEKMSFIDAFYCVCVTVTTLGYGDHTFQTATGRLFAAIWLLLSTACVAQLFLYIAECRTQNRQLELARWVLHRKTTRFDLESADLDGDGVVSLSASAKMIPSLNLVKLALGECLNNEFHDYVEAGHCRVLLLAAEFIIFKLKELGKIDDEDVGGILNEFRSLDYDRSGSISTHDTHFEAS